MTLEEIVNNLKSAGQDYGQLFNNNPRMDNFASVLQQGLGQLIPSNADFKSPEAMRDWGTAAALNAPLGLGIKNPNLNAGLLNKHLSGQKLTPEEMALYEKNGLAMETPQLQRYNLGNANAQGGSTESRAGILGWDTPAYHGNNADISVLNVEGKGKTRGSGGFLSSNPMISETYVEPFNNGNILPLLLNKNGFLETNAKGANWNEIPNNSLFTKRKPLTDLFDDLEKNDFTNTDELGFLARDSGYKGITIKNIKDLGMNSHIFRAKDYMKDKYGIDVDPEWSNATGNQFAEARDFMKKQYEKQKSDVTAIHDPSKIRSRFAAFDPLRKNSSSLLASGLLGSLLLKQMNQESSQQ